MEITVLSARGLKTNSSYDIFHHRLRPFITITTDTDHHCNVYATRVDDRGGVNPTWGDKFHVPLDSSFVSNMYNFCIYLELYSKRLIAGQSQLGWCRIPATDFASPLAAGTVRYLSYRLRDRDGTRGQGVINVAIRLVGDLPVASHVRPSQSLAVHNLQTVIGIPVMPHTTECFGCQGQLAVCGNWQSR
ncbi:hypothetical protein ACFE04_013272 [Oxalis oulophora]